MKRVSLAGLIAMRPPLLLLDDRAYLDRAATQPVSIVKKLHPDYAYSFVVVTHDMDLAGSLATRVVVKDGRIILDEVQQLLIDRSRPRAIEQ